MQARKAARALARRMNLPGMYRGGGAMDVVLQVLKDFGFPVACVIALFYLLQREQENHKSETASLTAAITELRVVLAKILTKIGDDSHE